VSVYIIKLFVYVGLSSLFLFVFGDDHVTCHMEADDIPSDVGDA